MDSQRLAETTLFRRAAQLLVYQWTKVAEKTGRIGKHLMPGLSYLVLSQSLLCTGSIGARQLEVRGHGRLVRMSRNFVNNLRKEMGGGGRGFP